MYKLHRINLIWENTDEKYSLEKLKEMIIEEDFWGSLENSGLGYCLKDEIFDTSEETMNQCAL